MNKTIAHNGTFQALCKQNTNCLPLSFLFLMGYFTQTLKDDELINICDELNSAHKKLVQNNLDQLVPVLFLNRYNMIERKIAELQFIHGNTEHKDKIVSFLEHLPPFLENMLLEMYWETSDKIERHVVAFKKVMNTWAYLDTASYYKIMICNAHECIKYYLEKMSEYDIRFSECSILTYEPVLR